MPAFIFVSGYFSKSINSRSSKSAWKMILCYLLFNTAMMIFVYCYLGTGLKLLTPYYSFWYIISLVCWRAIIGYVEKIKILIPLTFVITLLIGYWSEFTNVFSIRRTIAFFIFFAIGYLLDKEKVENFIAKRSAKIYVLGILLTAVFMICVPYMICEFDITSNATLMAAYDSSKDVYVRILLLVIAVAAIFILMLIVPNRKIPLISQWGKNSLLIYLGHRFLTIVFYKGLFTAGTYTETYLLYAAAATFITCLVLGNDKLSAGFNKTIGDMSEKIVDPDSADGNKLKAGIIIVFIICLLLRPALY